jgi:CBS domain-containing protein
MRERHVGVIIPEHEDGEQTPLGLITDRDILVEVLARGHDPCRVTIREIMCRPVVTAHTSDETGAALQRMSRHGMRRIPVMSEKRRLARGQLAANAAALTEVTPASRTSSATPAAETARRR